MRTVVVIISILWVVLTILTISGAVFAGEWEKATFYFLLLWFVAWCWKGNDR